MFIALAVACAPGGEPPVQGACGEGLERMIACGNCGTQTERCVAGRWEAQGECDGQGECAADTVETRALELCGEETRTCGAECAWSEWAVTTPVGECTPGETRTEQADCGPGMLRDLVCDDACAWTTPTDCYVSCGVIRVPDDADQEELCVPAGPFIRGHADHADAQPVAEVMLDGFFVDKFTVTNRRYAECVTAGACGLPDDGNGAATALADPGRAAFVVYDVAYEDAVAFCAWDGGRRLLTEAEWEKAARGAAPRANKYPWAEDTWRCDLVFSNGCAGYEFLPGQPWIDTYLNLEDFSSFNVVGLMSGGFQWTSDYYDPAYYADPSSLTNPQGPASGTSHVLKGSARHGAVIDVHAISFREATMTLGSIRCGRDADP